MLKGCRYPCEWERCSREDNLETLMKVEVRPEHHMGPLLAKF